MFNFNALTLFLPCDGVHAIEAAIVWVELDVGRPEAELVHLAARLQRDELEYSKEVKRSDIRLRMPLNAYSRGRNDLSISSEYEMS